METQPAAADVRAVLMRDRFAADLDVILRESHHDGKRGARASLAIGAMTYRNAQRRAGRRVAYRAAKAATLVPLRYHFAFPETILHRRSPLWLSRSATSCPTASSWSPPSSIPPPSARWRP